ncbi:MAG: hypothetical protein WCC22_08620 [Terriglobales bacterium]
MGFDSVKVAYNAGVQSAKRMPTWQAVSPFFVVGIVDVVKASHKHDLGDMIVAAVLWWVAAPVWVWWTRTKR